MTAVYKNENIAHYFASVSPKTEKEFYDLQCLLEEDLPMKLWINDLVKKNINIFDQKNLFSEECFSEYMNEQGPTLHQLKQFATVKLLLCNYKTIEFTYKLPHILLITFLMSYLKVVFSKAKEESFLKKGSLQINLIKIPLTSMTYYCGLDLMDKLNQFLSKKSLANEMFRTSLKKERSLFDARDSSEIENEVFQIGKVVINWFLRQDMVQLKQVLTRDPKPEGSFDKEKKQSKSLSYHLLFNNLSFLPVLWQKAYALHDLPMLTQPKDWYYSKEEKRFLGGYLTKQTPFIRRKDRAVRHKITGSLKPMIESANILQKKLFKINEKMYILINFLNSKPDHCITKTYLYPSIDKSVKTLLDETSKESDSVKVTLTEITNKLYYDVKKKKVLRYRHRVENKINVDSIIDSKKLAHILLLSKVKFLRGKTFRYVLTFDWRGRKYEIGINGFTSSDLSRSLICAAEERSLSKIAVEELLAYGANFFKRSYSDQKERLIFILGKKESLSQLIEARFSNTVVTNFLSYNEIKEKEIFSFFSWLLEINHLGFFRVENIDAIIGQKSAYLIRLDAVSSSLQHIGCLTIPSDSILQILNLVPQINAQDPYSKFAQDFAEFLKKKYPDLFILLEFSVTRSFIKLPLMTLFYGAGSGNEGSLFQYFRQALENENLGCKDSPELARRVMNVFIKFTQQRLPDFWIFLKGLKSIVHWRAKNEDNFSEVVWSPQQEVIVHQRYFTLTAHRKDLTFQWGPNSRFRDKKSNVKYEQTVKLKLWRTNEKKMNIDKSAISLAANVVQSFDATIMRYVLQKSENHLANYMMADIHDAIVCFPGNRTLVCKHYAEAFAATYTEKNVNKLWESLFGEKLLMLLRTNRFDIRNYHKNSYEVRIKTFYDMVFDENRLKKRDSLLNGLRNCEFMLS